MLSKILESDFPRCVKLEEGSAKGLASCCDANPDPVNNMEIRIRIGKMPIHNTGYKSNKKGVRPGE
jgi:hypothetical protein